MPINHNPLLNHLISKPRKRQNGRRVLTNKLESRLKRSNGICKSKAYDEFLEWIDSIQKKLDLNDDQFTKVLGITLRSFYRYKSRCGILPSKKVWYRLVQLDETLIKVNVNITKFKIGIRRCV
jgi:hypothetical protein